MSNVLSRFEESLKSIPDPHQRIDKILRFCNEYLDSLSFELFPILEKVIAESMQLGYVDGEVLARYCISYILSESRKIDDATSHIEIATSKLDQIKSDTSRGLASNYLAYINWYSGQYDKAFAYIYDAIKVLDKTGDRIGMGWSNYALGVFYYDTKDYQNATLNYKTAYEIFKSIDYKYGIARSLTGLASVKIQNNELEEAEEMLINILPIFRELETTSGETRALTDLAIIKKKQNNFTSALQFNKLALDARRKTRHLQGTISSLIEVGDISFQLGQYEEALKYLEEALELAEKVKARPKIIIIDQLLFVIYKSLGDSSKALEYLEKHHELKSEIIGEQTNNKIKQLQTQFATQKSEQEAEIHRLKNVELKKAYDEIEIKNKEILDSITYAKRLQEAILPPISSVKEQFPESFILYKPKDIVAGDFYWFENINGLILFGAADCTGHGVPGAMVSVVCSNALNRTVKEFGIIEPGKVLDKVRELVVETFERSESDVKDGMDISFCSFNKKTNELKWAGANNPLWIIRNNELIEYKPNKQPIGKIDNPAPFTTHSIQIQDNDCIYVFTDGYADQFGGEKEKKFKYKQLQEKLLAINGLSLSDQKNIMDTEFEKWKGSLEQVDDVLIIGLKI